MPPKNGGGTFCAAPEPGGRGKGSWCPTVGIQSCEDLLAAAQWQESAPRWVAALCQEAAQRLFGQVRQERLKAAVMCQARSELASAEQMLPHGSLAGSSEPRCHPVPQHCRRAAACGTAPAPGAPVAGAPASAPGMVAASAGGYAEAAAPEPPAAALLPTEPVPLLPTCPGDVTPAASELPGVDPSYPTPVQLEPPPL